MQRNRLLQWPLLRVLARLPDLSPLQYDHLLQAKLGALWRFLLRLAPLKRLLEQRDRRLLPRKQRLPKPQQVARVCRHILQRFADGRMRPFDHLFLNLHNRWHRFLGRVGMQQQDPPRFQRLFDPQ